jgi:3-deoxy-D-manno-octulosonic-acid transferase
LTRVAAQTAQDAQHLIKIGITPDKVTVVGNLKFECELPQQQVLEAQNLRKQLPYDFIIAVTSTHAGEEEQLLEIRSRLEAEFPNLLMIIVPRHPSRFDEVARLCQEKGYQIARRSNQKVPRDEKIFLGDSMGELYFYYALSDIAFVGGSLVPVGGHNILEPAALKLPIITGPHLFNFTAISSSLSSVESLIVTQDQDELYQAFCRLLRDPQLRQQMGLRGFQIFEQNQGAARRHLELAQEMMTA